MAARLVSSLPLPLAALLLASAPAAVRAQGFSSLCFPAHQYRWAIDVAGTTYRYDLSTLCKPSGTYS